MMRYVIQTPETKMKVTEEALQVDTRIPLANDFDIFASYFYILETAKQSILSTDIPLKFNEKYLQNIKCS